MILPEELLKIMKQRDIFPITFPGPILRLQKCWFRPRSLPPCNPWWWAADLGMLEWYTLGGCKSTPGRVRWHINPETMGILNGHVVWCFMILYHDLQWFMIFSVVLWCFVMSCGGVHIYIYNYSSSCFMMFTNINANGVSPHTPWYHHNLRCQQFLSR